MCQSLFHIDSIAADPHGGKSVDASTPSVRSTLGSSPSLRDMRTLDPGVEADLTERICQTSALSVLHSLPSAYEKEMLLEMLAALDNREGCTWPSGLRYKAKVVSCGDLVVKLWSI